MELAYTDFWEEVDFLLCLEGRKKIEIYRESIKETYVSMGFTW